MKGFLRLLLTFSALVTLTLAAGECYVRHLPNPARDKHEWMLAHSREVRTLVLGSSHTFYGLDPALLGPHAFSLAQVSQTYRYDDWLLRRYPTDSLRTVIVPFSYFSLYEDFEYGTGDIHYISRYRIYMDCPIHSVCSPHVLECTRFDAFKERLKSLWQPPRLTWTELGWGSNNRSELRPAAWDNGAERAKGNTYADTGAVNANTAFLASIFEFCRKRNVQVILLSTPLTPSFRDNECPEQRARNRHVLDRLLRKYPEVCRMDLEADSRFSDADFFDADHLSDRGAKKLSDIVRAALRP